MAGVACGSYYCEAAAWHRTDLLLQGGVGTSVSSPEFDVWNKLPSGVLSFKGVFSQIGRLVGMVVGQYQDCHDHKISSWHKTLSKRVSSAI